MYVNILLKFLPFNMWTDIVIIINMFTLCVLQFTSISVSYLTIFVDITFSFDYENFVHAVKSS